MRPDIEQRVQGIQKMIEKSDSMDNATKSMLTTSIAQSAEATNGLSTPDKIQALCVNVYALSENIALMALSMAALPCHGVGGSPHSCKALSVTTMGAVKRGWIEVILQPSWGLVTAFGMFLCALIFAPALQTLVMALITRWAG